MQHPVGYRYNPGTGRAELTDFWAVLINKVQLVTFPHTVLAAFLTGGAFMLGVAALADDPATARPTRTARCSARRCGFGAGGARRRARRRGHGRPAGQGDDRGAADEDGGRRGALRRPSSRRRSRSSPSARLDGVEGGVRGRRCPGLLSFLATGQLRRPRSRASTSCARSTRRPTGRPGATYYSPATTAEHPGDLLDLPADDRARPARGCGRRAGAVADPARARAAPTSRWWVVAGVALPLLPLGANSFGWIFTEMGRQPWVGVRADDHRRARCRPGSAPARC